MRELFIDASRGLAGDMLCAALLELFEEPSEMLERLNGIGVPGVRFRLEKKTSHGIAGSHLRVEVFGEEERQGVHGRHIHRSLGNIREIVRALDLSDALKEKVLQVYDRIAAAEAAAHGTTVEQVHFHELGALDAVADICAACMLIDALQPLRVTFSPVCVGFGSVGTEHGLLPVPAPATAKLLEGIPCYAGTIEGELCTPTGAALAAAFGDDFSHMPLFRPIRTGCGLGTKDFGALSCVRATLGEAEERIVELCCNVDDMSPEAVGFAIEELLRAGAPDAWYEPIGMKKCRPGLLLCCLCREDRRDEFVRLLFKHTTTIGIRETLSRRYVLKRREETAATPFGPVRRKLSEGYGVERRKAEFEDLARIARDRDLSLAEAGELLHDDR